MKHSHSHTNTERSSNNAEFNAKVKQCEACLPRTRGCFQDNFISTLRCRNHAVTAVNCLGALGLLTRDRSLIFSGSEKPFKPSFETAATRNSNQLPGGRFRKVNDNFDDVCKRKITFVITRWKKLLDFDWPRECEFIRNLRANYVIWGKLQFFRAKSVIHSE